MRTEPGRAERQQSPCGVVWFRRDLRLSDNPALLQALATHRRVVALFVWDPHLTGPAGQARLAFLEGVADLQRRLGGRLVLRRGDPRVAVAQVAQEAHASAVWCTEDFGPYGRRRDHQVAQALSRAGVALYRVDSPYAVAPGLVATAQGGPFKVFTPYLKAWRAQGWVAPLGRPRLPGAKLVALRSEALADAPGLGADLPPAGEAAALRRLDVVTREILDRYQQRRDRPDLEGTSRLSPYLKFGCIHPRQVLARLDPEVASHRRFAAELAWREFYADVLYHRPDSAREPWRPEWGRLAVDTGPHADARFVAWTQGRTGFPIVDAGMRQLLSEAWLHNRVRMIVASFLVKDLHLDWRRGARWFLEHLVDGDLASNQHGWQWVAGTGTDAAPFFRIFNPLAQAKRFDPNGDYVRRWVPELSSIRGPAVHEPWKARGTPPSSVGWRQHRGVQEGSQYPPPIVDHAVERREALARYAALRSSRRR